MRIERIEPQTRFAFRWHPYAVDPAADYSDEPMTLQSFEESNATMSRAAVAGITGLPVAPILKPLLR